MVTDPSCDPSGDPSGNASFAPGADPAPPWVASPFRADLFSRPDGRPGAAQVPGRVAIVTGGGTGIGRAIALSLSGCGARLAICGRRPEPLRAVAAEIRALGGECLEKTCDIR